MKYDYGIIRSHRKSISVSVSTDNKITVRCPWGLSRAKIDEFLDEKAAWIEKVVTENATRLAVNDDVIEHRKIYFNGKKIPLIIGGECKITPDAVYVRNTEDIERLYIDTCSEEFIKSVYELAGLTKLHPANVGVKSYKGRWGCCDAKNNLVFNFVLFMVPPELRRYVIVHELCHTLCHNHSDGFWKLVSEYVPDYKKIRKSLQYYNFLITLY